MLTKSKFKPLAVLACMTLVILALLCIGNTEADAATYSGYCGGEGDGTNLTWELTEDGTLTIEGSGEMKIYQTYSSIPWYSYRTQIVNAIIGDNVTSIGSYAFENCSSLTSVTIGDSVTSIGESAFYGCSSLTSVVIPDSVTSIGKGAFFDCSSLISVVIPDSVTIIEDYAFSWCSSLTSVVIPDSVTSIGEEAFHDCSSLTSVVIGDSVTSIASSAFYNCTALTQIYYNAKSCVDLSYNNHVFYNAGKNGSGIDVIIGNKVEKIPAYLFSPYSDSSCSPKITNVTFAENSVCESIGDSAFYDCSSLTSVTIGDSVTSIGRSVFYGCRSLTSVTIGDSVTSIGSSAFSNCSSLTSVHITDIAKWCGISFGNYSDNPLYYAKNLYVNGTLLTELFIPDSVTSIGSYAFFDCSSLISVVIPDSVTIIEDYAFSWCSSLTSVVIGDSVTSIGDSAFSNCSSLTSIAIGDSVTSIASYAFYNCTALTQIYYNAKSCVDLSSNNYVFYNAGKNGSGIDVIIGNKVEKIPAYLFYPYSNSSYSPKITNVTFAENSVCESIGDSAFYDCSSLTSVTISDSVTSIGTYAFRKCTSLTSVVIGDSVTSIGDSAFYGCSSLTSVTIPDSVTSIGNSAFYNCSSLKSVVIPDSVTSIGDSAFYGCSSLKSVVIPDSVTSIGTYAFRNCTSLTSVTIPDSVTSIGNYAFFLCTGLTSVTIGDSVTSIGTYAFSWCSSLTSIVIPDSVTSIGDSAFFRCSSLTSVIFTSPCGWKAGNTAIEKDALLDPANAAQLLTSKYKSSTWSKTEAIAQGEAGNGLNWVLLDNGTMYVYGNGSMPDYNAGATPWAAYADKITKVVIEEGVVSVGRCAFHSLAAVTEVVLPDGLMIIDEYAFYGCTGVTSFDIPASVYYVGAYAFRKSGAVSITFGTPDGWTAGGVAADANDTVNLTKNLYKKVWMRPVDTDGEIIASGVFGKKDAFNWTLTADGVLTVNGSGAMPEFGSSSTPWYGYKAVIRRISVGEGITSIGRTAFYGCRPLISVTLPSTLETVSEYAFYNCINLSEINIPASVTNIGKFAFRKCASLDTVEFAIPYGWSAGDGKLSATEVTVSGADMLTKAYYKLDWVRDPNAEAEEIDPDFVDGGMCNTLVKWTLTYIDEARTQMKLTVSGSGAMPEYGTGAAPWYGYADSIVEIEVCEGVTTVGRCAFYGLKKVTKVTLSESITAIGDYAFNSCKALTEIAVPSTVTVIGKDAFAKTGLSEIPTV